MTPREEQDFLARVRAGEEAAPSRERARRQHDRLFLRNILNGIFMLLAIAAMVAIAYALHTGSGRLRTWGYGAGIVAVLVKMVEATLRMTTMLRQPRENLKHRHYDNRRNNPS